MGRPQAKALRQLMGILFCTSISSKNRGGIFPCRLLQLMATNRKTHSKIPTYNIKTPYRMC